MSLYLDQTYLKLIGFRLDRFKEKRTGSLWNCKCHLCGDSTKKQSKARGYFIAKGNKLNYWCHNCGASKSFGNFLKEFDVNLYREYTVEKFKENQGVVRRPKRSESDMVLSALKNIPKTQTHEPDITSDLPKIDDLPDSHPAKKYIIDRQIPEEFHGELCYVEKFFGWSTGHTDKFHRCENDHGRLIIPWYTESGQLFAYSARTLGREQPKYFNIVIDENHPKFYGLHRIDRSKRIYVVEGQFDSMYIANCVAVGNSAIGQFHATGEVTYIPDRDVRNSEIMKITKRLIDLGNDVCLLPMSLKGHDINEIMVENKLTKKELMNIIDCNTFSGMQASLEFTRWAKT